MCIILIMIVIKNRIIFLINSSSPGHCRLTVTSSVFFSHRTYVTLRP